MTSGGQAEKQLVQTLRGDLSLICNEARKRYPAVREVSLRGVLEGSRISGTTRWLMVVMCSRVFLAECRERVDETEDTVRGSWLLTARYVHHAHNIIIYTLHQWKIYRQARVGVAVCVWGEECNLIESHS